MKILPALLIGCGMLAGAQARPLFITESARIHNPDPSYETFATAHALDGDEAFISSSHYIENDPEDQFDDQEHMVVNLWQRVNGTWMPIRKVSEFDDYYHLWNHDMDMKNGIAAFSLPFLKIFEKKNGDWAASPISSAPDGPGYSIHVDGQRVFTGATSGSFEGSLLQKNASGTWGITDVLQGEYRGGDDEQVGRQVGISGNRAVVMSPYTEDSQGFATPNVAVYRNLAGWQREFVIENSDATPVGEALDIHDDEIVVSGSDLSGSLLYRPVNGGPNWTVAQALRPPGSYMGGGSTYDIVMTDAYVLQQNFDFDRNASVVNIFTKDANGKYSQVATLTSSKGESVGAIKVSGRRVMLGCGEDICFYDLPASLTQPNVLQDTFAAVTPTGWSFSAGSQFALVQSGASRVLRQSETTSPATHTALLDDSNWTNESIEADVRPTAFNGTDRWVGLAARYLDAGNFYYVTLRASNKVLLRKLVNGAQVTLGSAQLPATLNHNYRLRLEAVNNRLRVYVDGALLLDAFDATFGSGRAGLLAYRAAADFDNVIVSPTPDVTLSATVNGQPLRTGYWTFTGNGAWSYAWDGTQMVYPQTSTSGDARALTAAPTDDQQVEFAIRATAFDGGSGSDRWFGAIARYKDDSNYYYVSLRSGGTISLRKVVGGTIGVLATTGLPVALGTWYQLRLEVVGTRLRVYVNGTLTLEANDSALTSGQMGVVTYRTAAQFKEFHASQP